MTSDSFPRKVSELRKTWLGRRVMKRLHNRRDLESRFELLQVLHGWALECVNTIAEVYGETMAIEISDPPDLKGQRLSFSVTIEEVYRLAFAIHPHNPVSPQWELVTDVMTPKSIVPAAKPRGAGQWTPYRVEELLLSLLAAVERARFDACRPPIAQSSGRTPRSRRQPLRDARAAGG